MQHHSTPPQIFAQASQLSSAANPPGLQKRGMPPELPPYASRCMVWPIVLTYRPVPRCCSTKRFASEPRLVYVLCRRAALACFSDHLIDSSRVRPVILVVNLHELI